MTFDPNAYSSRQGLLESLRWHKFSVLDDGFVTLVDVMGDDDAVVQAARVSYGQDKREGQAQESPRQLIRYLMRHRHSTPFEMAEVKLLVRVPMDTWRQWIRHRTACLSGDAELHFDLPGRERGLYKLTVRQVFEKFQPTENKQRPDKQRNAYHKRDRIQSMQLRCVDEDTGEILHTQIVDVWESGEKNLYKLSTENGKTIRTSGDHLFFTPDGWKKLKELRVGDDVITLDSRTGAPPASFNEIDSETEEWAPIVGWEGWYEISDQGRVRRIVGGKGSRSHGRCKKLTVSFERAVTGLNKPGKQESILVHREMLRTFVGEPEPGQEACHENGNSLDNRLDNLRWGTRKENAEDMSKHGRSTFLCSSPSKIISIVPDGKEMTYDVEVTGPWHNFSANGIIVHNSVNEYSTRYTEAIDSAQKTKPDEWRLQSGSNKQGSDGFIPAEIDQHPNEEDTPENCSGAYLSRTEKSLQNYSRSVYEERIKAGVAREQARKDLPLSTYTEAYWKIDLHNMLHFLGLRMDSHAQKEIRDYATTIGEQIIKPLFPIVWEAFEDYRLGAMTLTRLDILMMNRLNPISHASRQFLIQAFMEECNQPPFKENGWDKDKCRERDECRVKLERLGLL